MTTTNRQYDEAIKSCRDIFIQKTSDYGTAWRVLRTISVADQLFIKAKRIRTIQEKKTQKIGDNIASEFKGILNYAVIGLIQLELPEDETDELGVERAGDLYNDKIMQARALMQDKN
ncbi:MAG TPA: DUF1599 domain-containing protein, partial [Chitinophagaceae bacterium]|nr:DUF1599 domain-containing protein [Chitinophagaceae bacterium]